MIQRSTKKHANNSMTTHSFSKKRGYVDHGEQLPEPAGGPTQPASCLPPLGTESGTLHRLTFQGVEHEFSWVGAEKAWSRPGGNRLAWPARYLATAGWRYVGRVT